MQTIQKQELAEEEPEPFEDLQDGQITPRARDGYENHVISTPPTNEQVAYAQQLQEAFLQMGAAMQQASNTASGSSPSDVDRQLDAAKRPADTMPKACSTPSRRLWQKTALDTPLNQEVADL